MTTTLTPGKAQPAFTNPSAPAMVTVEVIRLEKQDPATNQYKQYTAVANGKGWCLFGYSRIGATWQWSDKSGGDSLGKMWSQLNRKRSEGYQEVHRVTTDIPQPWLDTFPTHKRLIQDHLEAAYREQAKEHLDDFYDTPGTPVPTSPFGDILAEARRVIGVMTVNPDKAVADYVALSERVDEAKDELLVVNGYIETLQLMLMGGSA